VSAAVIICLISVSAAILRLLNFAADAYGDPNNAMEFVPTGEPLLIFVPKGPAWGVVAELLQRALNILPDDASQLALGFMEDWSKQCSYYTAYPKSSRELAQIALHYLSSSDSRG
jgi:hypothetical protein